MNVILLGAAGFIGTNLALKLAENDSDIITLVDKERSFFSPIEKKHLDNVCILEAPLDEKTKFGNLLHDQDVVYHLVSTTAPTTSNQQIPHELMGNIIFSANLLEACAQCNVRKVVFISSGGTVYGKDVNCPIKEDSATDPINSYGLQKLAIEKLLYLYHYIHGYDYRIIRLANLYGPYQRPNGVLGAVTTFIYKALKNEEISVYGDGSVIRDFIYIDDAIRAIMNIVNGENHHKTFNVGSGYGTNINDVLKVISEVLESEINIKYGAGRKVDVPCNYLDISRYESAYGKLDPIPLKEGVKRTIEYLRKYLL